MAAEIDFETYSEAGYEWNDVAKKWHSAAGKGKTKRGLELVGAAAYAEHPSTEVLCLYYDLNDGGGQRCWLPWMLPPADLLAYVQRGGIVEAHNSGFEFVVWYYVLHLRFGWPMLQDTQMACTKAQCRAWALPGALGKVGEILNLPTQKDADGVRLLKKFSMPRNPTKGDPRRRELPHLDRIDGPKLYAYCGQDIAAERCVAAAVPPLSPAERELWIIDQRINFRGVQIDIEAVELLIKQYEQYAAKAEAQIQRIAGCSYSEVQKIIDWLASRKIFTVSLDADAIDTLMDRLRDSGQLHGEVWQVLKIRRDYGSSSVKKLYSLRHWVNSDHRARYLLEYHGAQTGRWAGRGPQPQNMPSKGPAVVRSECCGTIRAASLQHCPYCPIMDPSSHKAEWGPEGVDRVVQDCRGAGLFNWPDPVAAISGCLRGMFIAKPGHDLISSDYSAIEAVVLAMLAGEQWRIDVFRTHGKIYEMSAAKISGVPFDEIANHKKLYGEHHPLRKGVGKVAELASGYAGWIGAWKAFGADAFMTEQEIKQAILAWRDASPMIVEFWGGQWRKDPNRWHFTPELYGMEGAAVSAVLNPGQCYAYRGITWGVVSGVLYCQLPSGRFITYHSPRLDEVEDQRSLKVWSLSYMGADPTTGQWVRIPTYGGKLTENVVQAVARDILANALVNLERAGYPVVLHVHDEIVSEVPQGFGSIEDFERVMATMPAWAADWPIKAAGGWRGRRYRKD